MDLNCFVMDGWEPRIRPASSRRDWMEATPERFAYRCLPLAIANAFGWEMLSPCGFEARWNGGSGIEDVEIRIDPGAGGRAPVSLFGQGTITFHIEALIQTPPGWSLWVGGSPNDAKDGISPLGGIIETDWSPYSFTMNWRFTRPNHWVRFEKDEAICFFFPIERALFDMVTPRIRPLDEAPALRDAFLGWSDSRNAFQKWVEETKPTAPADRWQKLYYRGLRPDGEIGTDDHLSKVKVPQFQRADGAFIEAPPPPSRCPASRAVSAAAVAAGDSASPSDLIRSAVAMLASMPQSEALSIVREALPAAVAGTADALLSNQVAVPVPATDAARALSHRNWILEAAERQRALAPPGLEESGLLPGDAFLERYYAAGRPVVMRGAIADWPALARWTPDYLRKRVGNCEVEFQGRRDTSPKYELYKDEHRETMAFDRFIDLVERSEYGNDAYLTAYNSGRNREALSILDQDVRRIEPLLRGEPGMMWIGPGGTFTPLHFDLTNNLLAQIVGTKHLVLLPPSETPRLANHRHVFSDVHDITDPEQLEKFPQAREALQYEITLNPGDLLYIPVGWWHQVVAENFSVMQTYTDFRWANDAYERFPTSGR